MSTLGLVVVVGLFGVVVVVVAMVGDESEGRGDVTP
jgi:hypothetical protein